MHFGHRFQKLSGFCLFFMQISYFEFVSYHYDNYIICKISFKRFAKQGASSIPLAIFLFELNGFPGLRESEKKTGVSAYPRTRKENIYSYNFVIWILAIFISMM